MKEILLKIGNYVFTSSFYNECWSFVEKCFLRFLWSGTLDIFEMEHQVVFSVRYIILLSYSKKKMKKKPHTLSFDLLPIVTDDQVNESFWLVCNRK